MSALKKSLDDMFGVVVAGLRHAGDGIAVKVGQMRDHLDEAIGRVKGLDDELGAKVGSLWAGPSHPGFKSDGTVDAADFATAPDTAYFWSGRIGGPDGDGVEPFARDAADDDGGTTLEQLLEERGIEMPEWDDKNDEVVDTWTKASEAYASEAKGKVHVVLGDSVRPDAVWHREFEQLKGNAKVTEIIQVHPTTGSKSVIWP